MAEREIYYQKVQELESLFQKGIELLEKKCRQFEKEGQILYECDFETATVVIPLVMLDYIKSQLEFLQPDITISLLEIRPKSHFWKGDEDTAMLLFAPYSQKFLLLPYEF